MELDLTDYERQALLELLTHEIEFAPSPLSPRVERLGRIRAKLSRVEPSPARRPTRHRPARR